MTGLISISAHLGYPILAALVAAESVGVPVPGETALITAAILARNGHLHIAAVIAIVATAAIIGDNLGYLLGRKGGRTLLERPGPFQTRRRELLDKGQPFFARHGGKAVFLGRWISGLRIAAAWLAGINRMPWPAFLFYNAAGGIAWATSVGLAAYLAGPIVERVFRLVGLAGVAVALAVVIAIWAWRHFQTTPRTPKPQPPASSGTSETA